MELGSYKNFIFITECDLMWTFLLFAISEGVNVVVLSIHILTGRILDKTRMSLTRHLMTEKKTNIWLRNPGMKLFVSWHKFAAGIIPRSVCELRIITVIVIAAKFSYVISRNLSQHHTFVRNWVHLAKILISFRQSFQSRLPMMFCNIRECLQPQSLKVSIENLQREIQSRCVVY